LIEPDDPTRDIASHGFLNIPALLTLVSASCVADPARLLPEMEKVLLYGVVGSAAL
jgi:hypothetical protein